MSLTEIYSELLSNSHLLFGLIFAKDINCPCPPPTISWRALIAHQLYEDKMLWKNVAVLLIVYLSYVVSTQENDTLYSRFNKEFIYFFTYFITYLKAFHSRVFSPKKRQDILRELHHRLSYITTIWWWY